jgi:hypothetical protein
LDLKLLLPIVPKLVKKLLEEFVESIDNRLDKSKKGGKRISRVSSLWFSKKKWRRK